MLHFELNGSLYDSKYNRTITQAGVMYKKIRRCQFKCMHVTNCVSVNIHNTCAMPCAE